MKKATFIGLLFSARFQPHLTMRTAAAAAANVNAVCGVAQPQDWNFQSHISQWVCADGIDVGRCCAHRQRESQSWLLTMRTASANVNAVCAAPMSENPN